MFEPSPLVLIALGASTGLVGSLLGLGGGVFLVPLLTLSFGVPLRAAVAASLVSVIATASASSTINLERGLVNLRLGMALEVATAIGGLAGGLLAAWLSQRQLFLVFGAVLGAMGVLMALRSGRRNLIPDPAADPGILGGRIREGDAVYVYRVKRLGVGLGSSVLAGAVSGLLGLGGGIVKVPVLNAFCGIPIRVAAATSAFMIGVTATAGAVIYYGTGQLVPALAASAVLGVQLGSWGGMRFGQRASAMWLKLLMAAVLFVVSAVMFTRGIQ